MSDLGPLRVLFAWIASLHAHAVAMLQRLATRSMIARAFTRRVPVLLQMNAGECGAACLAMILNYYGRKVRVAECREVCGVGRDGLTALTISKAARWFGLRVNGFSLEPRDFRYAPLPAIAHWEFNHFVIVERWSCKQVELVDPAIGRRTLTAAEFGAGFTGVLLALEPSIDFKSHRRTRKPAWRNFLGAILQTAGVVGLLGQILVASLCLLLLGLALPLFTKLVVDRLLPLHMVNVMTRIGVGLVLVAAALAVATYLRTLLLLYLRSRLDRQMMLGFFEHLLSLPFRFFQQRNSGDLLMRLASNTMIRETLTNQTLSAILDSTVMAGYVAILIVRDPSFGVMVLVLGLLQVAVVVGTSRYVTQLTQRSLVAQAESQSYLVEALSGVASLKASGTEHRAMDHWSNLFTKELNTALRSGHLGAVVDTVITTLRTLSPLVLLWAGTLRVLEGRMSLGTMFALIALATAFLQPLSSLVSSAQRMQLVSAYLERIADVVDAEPEQNFRTVHAAPRLSGQIEFKNVSFRYDPNAPLVLNNISLVIEPGQKIALVGRTGSGKSTLALLLLGLYQPTGGEILCDNIPLQRLNYRELRSQFGVVLQEPFLFSGSIRHNIAFGNPNLALGEIAEAARLAAIDEDIALMPMGFETNVAEGGSGLSGGQRQRLSLARALALKPSVLVLDEATSHLDVATERRIEENLRQLTCTRITIAHRLSTIRDADRIFVLEGGSIVEMGSHEELISHSGYYANLMSRPMEPAMTA
jgi:ABC-type bacteriocin/lantibiotic exporter with double-glycine peptidase domain